MHLFPTRNTFLHSFFLIHHSKLSFVEFLIPSEKSLLWLPNFQFSEFSSTQYKLLNVSECNFKQQCMYTCTHICKCVVTVHNMHIISTHHDTVPNFPLKRSTINPATSSNLDTETKQGVPANGQQHRLWLAILNAAAKNNI